MLFSERISVFFLFLFISLINGNAQLSSLDSLEEERIYGKMMQLNEEGKVELALIEADSLINFYEHREAWYDAYGVGLVWKIIIAALNDRVEIVYDNIKLQQIKIEEHSNELGEQAQLLKIDNKLRLGSYFVQRGNMLRAQKEYESLLNEVEEKEDFVELAGVFMYLSKIHKYQGNYAQALSYINECKEAFFNVKTLYPLGYESLIHKHTADIHALLRNNELAKDNYEKAVQLNDEVKNPTRVFLNGVVNNYNAFAQFYLNNGNTQLAINLLKKSLKLQKKSVSKTQETYRLLAEAYIENNEYSKAEEFLKESIIRNNYDGKNYHLARTYTLMAETYISQNKLETALEYYQKALINLQDNFNSEDFCENPIDFKDMYIKKDAISVFHEKALVLYELGESNPSYLSCAWKTIQIGINLLDEVRINNLSDSDKHVTLKENYQIFEDAIKISLAQPNGVGIPYAFEAAEKSKASQLLSAVRNTQVRNFYVPDSLIDLEEQYKYEIRTLEEKNGISTLSNEQLDKQKKLNDLITFFKRDYPDYYQLRYNTTVITTDSLRNELKNNKTLVEYFVGQKQVYIFLMQKDISVKAITVDIKENDLTKLTQELLYAIYLPHIDTIENRKLKNLYTKSYADSVFASNAFKLYELLIQPIQLAVAEISNIEIIPDGVLNYLPFDALIQQNVRPEMIGFYENEKDYKYLARDYRISYCYSATLMDLMNKNKSVSENRLLVLHDNEFVEQTVSIKNIFKQYDFFQSFVNILDEKANKEQLKKQSSNYKYLHFSVHGVINNNHPSQSYLQLRPTSQGDSLLYLKDIYNTSFPADMVITSACNAGVGPLAKGEGLLSLARGFTYSGAKSLITTLWEIKGGASNQLLKSFYSNIRDGATKDEALFLAKKANLNAAAYAHPYYWAGFIPIGNMEAIQMPFLSLNKLLFGGLSFLGLLIFFLFKRK